LTGNWTELMDGIKYERQLLKYQKRIQAVQNTYLSLYRQLKNEGGSGGRAPLILHLTTSWVSDESHAPASLLQGTVPGTQLAGPKYGVDF
jgi:hypothetical protein